MLLNGRCYLQNEEMALEGHWRLFDFFVVHELPVQMPFFKRASRILSMIVSVCVLAKKIPET